MQRQLRGRPHHNQHHVYMIPQINGRSIALRYPPAAAASSTATKNVYSIHLIHFAIILNVHAHDQLVEL